ncbi:unnamed protein product [Nesidiocoris tenuis]|uniref:Uncharacterized protein n=1 Tax=Nesidiocoris tenuis TaxID=355587 RepID=A0A6H5GPY4_9HEMI|nr:unnamed protein product [Nesidiocoris tenuis]
MIVCRFLVTNSVQDLYRTSSGRVLSYSDIKVMLLLAVSALTFLTVIGCQASLRDRRSGRGSPFEGCPDFDGRSPDECPGCFPGFQHLPPQPPEYALPPGYYDEGQSPYTNSPYWRSPLLFDRPANFGSPPDTCPSFLSSLQNRLHHAKRPTLKPAIPKLKALKDQTRKLLDDLLPKYPDSLHSPVYRGHHIEESDDGRDLPNFSSQLANPPTDQDFEASTQFSTHSHPKMPYPTQAPFGTPKHAFRNLQQRQQIQQYRPSHQVQPQHSQMGHFPTSASQFIADEEHRHLQRPMAFTTTPKPPFGNGFFDDFLPKYVETVPPPTCPASQVYKLQLGRPKIQGDSHLGQEDECPQGSCPAHNRYSAGSSMMAQNHQYGGSLGSSPVSSSSYAKR